MTAADNEQTGQKTKRALVIRVGGIGDILMTTPTVRQIAQAYPEHAFDWIVGKGQADSVAGLPYACDVTEFDKNGAERTLAAFKALLEKVQSRGYDLVVNLHPSVKTLIIQTASGARRAVAVAKDLRVQPELGHRRHAIDDFGRALAKLGLPPLESQQMDFAVPAESHARVAQMFDDAGIRDGDRVLTINTGSTKPANRWEPERFAAVIDSFAARPGVKVVVVGSAGDAPLVEAVLARSQSRDLVADLHGRLALKDLGAVMARTSCLLTCDTGPMHIAAAMSASIVALFGRADPERTGPITAESTVLIDRSLACISCMKNQCRWGDDYRCMKALSAESVIAAIGGKLIEANSGVVALPVV